jgi:hypothetical protein
MTSHTSQPRLWYLIHTIAYPVDQTPIREPTSLCLNRNNCRTTGEPVTPALGVTPRRTDQAMVMQHVALTGRWCDGQKRLAWGRTIAIPNSEVGAASGYAQSLWYIIEIDSERQAKESIKCISECSMEWFKKTLFKIRLTLMITLTFAHIIAGAYTHIRAFAQYKSRYNYIPYHTALCDNWKDTVVAYTDHRPFLGLWIMISSGWRLSWRSQLSAHAGVQGILWTSYIRAYKLPRR